MTYAAADRFPAVSYALLTRGCHQRASWRYRFEHGARVVAPARSWGLLTEPDQHYVEGTRLPADFRAIRTPGPEYDHYSLYRPGEPSILFIGDLVTRRDSSGPLQLSDDAPRLRARYLAATASRACSTSRSTCSACRTAATSTTIR